MKSKNIVVFSSISIFLFLGVFFVVYSSENDVLPEGWFPAGKSPADYEMGVDSEVFHSGKSSGFIKSLSDNPSGFGTLMQMCQAKEYLEKRVRMNAYIKAENIINWAGMWMRVDGSGRESLGFDNMQQRSIIGSTGWEKYEIVLDVPENSTNLAFGILLDRSGQDWIDDICFEVVGLEVPTTGYSRNGSKNDFKYPDKPIYLDFEK